MQVPGVVKAVQEFGKSPVEVSYAVEVCSELVEFIFEFPVNMLLALAVTRDSKSTHVMAIPRHDVHLLMVLTHACSSGELP